VLRNCLTRTTGDAERVPIDREAEKRLMDWKRDYKSDPQASPRGCGTCHLDGVRHSVEVTADTLCEAAVLGLKELLVS
jgi:hypothetical protein